MSWVAVGVGVAGLAVSAYGQYSNNKNQKKAIAANEQNVDDTNARNYQMWLESRGIGADGRPVNALLPRYMSWSMPNYAPPGAAPTEGQVAAPLPPSAYLNSSRHLPAPK